MGLPEHKLHTWQEYQTWGDDHRYELIGGEVFDMTPAPRPSHQTVANRLSLYFNLYLRGKKCQLFQAPTDVVLSDYDVVQPDLFVVCRPEQVRDTHIADAPALVIEILSPSTRQRDRTFKRKLYARSGVLEYWLVDGDLGEVEVLLLGEDGLYKVAESFVPGDTLTSPSFPGLEIPSAEVFDLPKGWEIRETNSPPPEDVRKTE